MSTPDPLPVAPQISVIIPARNEEASLAACLESLVAQSGVEYEIIVVNDQSTDRTREIAASFPKVKVIDAAELPDNWTGKNNAVSTGARAARGHWLLFTDADTVHIPGSLSRALAETEQYKVDMLSYSPEQIAVTFWEMAVLPVVFAELARQYPPSKVSDPNSPDAAANGQYILVKREAYDAVGGHAAVAPCILEDVALARAFKSAGRKIRFRYAADAVRTRMYRNFSQLREGWTKNLALLFPKPVELALKSLFLWLVGWTIFVLPMLAQLPLEFPPGQPLSRSRLLAWIAALDHSWLGGSTILGFLFLTMRLRRANFDVAMEFLGALVGMPMFAYLLLRSKRAHASGHVSWKGRNYDATKPPQDVNLQNHPVAGRLS